MSLRTAFYGTALTAASLLTSGCATTIGGATVTYQPPVDLAGNVRETAKPGRPAFVFQTVENANPSNITGGCGANAIFVPNRGFTGFGSNNYIFLNEKELNNLLTTGVTRDGIFMTRSASQFDHSQLEAALRAVKIQKANNAHNNRLGKFNLCMGYN